MMEGSGAEAAVLIMRIYTREQDRYREQRFSSTIMKLLTPVLIAVLATLSSAATISPQLYIQSQSPHTTSTDLINVCGNGNDLLT